MKQYLDLLQEILDNGVEKESGRANMPNTKEISFGHIRMDLDDGFPLLTTKKMFWKGIVHELLWFLRGETNIKYLVDNNVNIWNGDAYRWYLKYAKEAGVEPMGMELFIAEIKANDNELPRPFAWWQSGSAVVQNYRLGDLGKVYGYQWRNQNGVDQIADIMKDLKENPYGRYKILDGWNKRDFRDMALPPCHLLYHFIPRPISNQERNEWYRNNGPIHTNRYDPDHLFDNEFLDKEGVPKFYLDLNMYQRSCDTVLGVPFNIASMSLLLIIIAKAVGMKPGVCNWVGGHTHLYMDHLPMAKEQISRDPRPLPELRINKEIHSLEDIENLSIDDFEVVNYNPHDRIKAELFTGVKK
jgi:thymidylate synthase